MNIKITAILFLSADCRSWPKLGHDLGCPRYDWYQVGIRPIIIEYFAHNEALQSEYYCFQHTGVGGKKVAQEAHCSLHPTVWLYYVLAMSEKRREAWWEDGMGDRLFPSIPQKPEAVNTTHTHWIIRPGSLDHFPKLRCQELTFLLSLKVSCISAQRCSALGS